MKIGRKIDGFIRYLASRAIVTTNETPLRKILRKCLPFKRDEATPPETHRIGQVWHRSARLKAMIKGREIDSLPPMINPEKRTPQKMQENLGISYVSIGFPTLP